MAVDQLETILASRKKRVAEAKQRMPLAEVERLAKMQPAAPSFLRAIRVPNEIRVIAEFKRSSPSAGNIRVGAEVAPVTIMYEKGGAAALSILAEPDFFGGRMEDLKNARTATALPVLLKDFVFDEYQILEAKMVGASAVLLIADMIPASQLKQLAKFAKSVGLDTLVEVFTDASVEAAIKTDSEILGINTRNLRTLEMNPARVEQLISQIPKDRALVAESGVKTVADIARLKKLSVAAVLVGESLLKQNDPMSGVRALVEAGKK